MNLQDLKLPFPAEDLEWRIQSSGTKDGKVWAMCVVYVTNRAIMNRLDEVCGPENWKNEEHRSCVLQFYSAINGSTALPVFRVCLQHCQRFQQALGKLTRVNRPHE